MATGAAINTDTATPAIRQIAVKASGRSAHVAMAASVAELIRRHLIQKDQVPNKLGGQRTHFYAAAAGQTFWTASANEAEVTVAKDGIRQRLLGGEIKPVKAKALTIPVNPLAYGRRAAEFGDELRLVIFGGTSPNPNRIGMLVLGADAQAPIYYILALKVTQGPDPSVLPTDDEMLTEAVGALKELALAP